MSLQVMVQLYSKVNDPLDVGTVTKQEMANESKEMQRVFDENKSLREQVELLKSQARSIYQQQVHGVLYRACV